MPAPLPTRRFSDRPLRPEPAVAVYIVEHGRPLPADAALVLLPGSKATLADLTALRAEGWDIDLQAHVRRGGLVVGLCGGYQMLGTRIADPGGVEGPAGESKGLCLTDIETALAPAKTLRMAAGFERSTGMTATGYENHMGRPSEANSAQPGPDPRAQGPR